MPATRLCRELAACYVEPSAKRNSAACTPINTTLSRTVLTSGTTLLTVFVLFLFGGEVLRGFALALLVGIGVGTYSSIFVASPLVVLFRDRFMPAGRRRVSVARG